MKLPLAFALCFVVAGCSSAEQADDSPTQAAGALTQSSDPTGAEAVVRRYYAAAAAADPAKELEPITADDVVLEAPSVLILKPLGLTDEVHGKAAFVKAVTGGAFLLSAAKVAPPGSKNDGRSQVAMAVVSAPDAEHPLVMSRIQLPLPNGDLLTQVEFFEVNDGKIVHMQSYYDAARFIKALPAIGIAKLKSSLGL